MPVLEAFSCECPVIVSNTSSFPEVAQDAALYIDPYNEDCIRESIEMLMTDSELRKKLISAGFKRSKLFTWEKTAELTKNIYLEATQ